MIDNYRKALKRRNNNKSGDAANKKLATCEFFDQLTFIDVGIPCSETDNNFTSPQRQAVHTKNTPVSDSNDVQLSQQNANTEMEPQPTGASFLGRRKKAKREQ